MGDQTLSDAFVNAGVVPANEDQARRAGKLVHHVLAQYIALGRRESHRGGGSLLVRDIGQCSFHRREHGLRFHHHARAAPELVIVRGAVPVRRMIPYVDGFQRDQAGADRPSQDAVVLDEPERVGEESQDGETHRGAGQTVGAATPGANRLGVLV